MTGQEKSGEFRFRGSRDDGGDEGAEDFDGTVDGGSCRWSIIGESVKATGTRAGVGLREV